MDSGAIKAAAAATTATYQSFADATRSVLDLLVRLVPDATLYLAHLDRQHAVHRIVDVRSGGALGLHSNQATALQDSLDLPMAEDRAPRLCNDVAGHPVYGAVAMRERLGARAYLAVPLELSDGARVGSLAAVSTREGRFRTDDEQLFTLLARVLAHELERESNQRDVRRMEDSLRDHARGMGALGRVVRDLAVGEDARRAVCRAACEMAGAPVAFLLEPSGREFVSTAMHGVDMPAVTIQPRAEAAGRAFTARETYFVADARNHPALAAPLVTATGARSALFEPVLRDGQVCGVLILVWQLAIAAVPEGAAGMLRLLAGQAAVAIEHAGLRARMATLNLTDPLTGVSSRRVFEEELPRELARARRGDHPVSIAFLDLDHLAGFNLLRGRREGDRLIKEAGALWRGELREVDTLARIGGATFAVILPNCGLADAVDVLDRVRSRTPRNQTASAGVARWDGEEPAELLRARAEEALRTAKQSGRDVTVAAE
ncbi:MAG TPA: sensor domain-containing diguanylate cyclase [Solirubrobacteraceae bacterium]|nr:sensor domain-containing diguanylate cyclase [Solirubrobacteraceae bacterium]